jgi:hypothetical protein
MGLLDEAVSVAQATGDTVDIAWIRERSDLCDAGRNDTGLKVPSPAMDVGHNLSIGPVRHSSHGITPRPK